MAGVSLLVLLDDIAAILDDVALLTKVAAKKTAGVLGDDLALNAQQVSGVRAERELPVVWAVAKGSFINKLILVPAALVLSAVLPWIILPLLLLGGLFLCYEGFEKVLHYFSHKTSGEQGVSQIGQHLLEAEADFKALEKNKIRGAIRTDFILSAEIIIIALSTVADSSFTVRISVISLIALFMTIGVYGLVAVIVKIDDAGLALTKVKGSAKVFLNWFGWRLLDFAPMLMKTLTVVGTIAMFLVGGGIVVHVIHDLEHFIHDVTSGISPTVLLVLSSTLFSALVGVIAGFVIYICVCVFGKIATLTGWRKVSSTH